MLNARFVCAAIKTIVKPSCLTKEVLLKARSMASPAPKNEEVALNILTLICTSRCHSSGRDSMILFFKLNTNQSKCQLRNLSSRQSWHYY